MAVNQKLRRGGKLSAYEISSARDCNTGENLEIKDEEFRNKQLEKRHKENEIKEKLEPKAEQEVKVGDTVVVLGSQDKHTARETFIVTDDREDKVRAQKLLHPFTKPKLMSKQYETDKKRLFVVRTGVNKEQFKQVKHREVKYVKAVYDPVNKDFWNDDSDNEEVVKTIKKHTVQHQQVQQEEQEQQVHE